MAFLRFGWTGQTRLRHFCDSGQDCVFAFTGGFAMHIWRGASRARLCAYFCGSMRTRACRTLTALLSLYTTILARANYLFLPTTLLSTTPLLFFACTCNAATWTATFPPGRIAVAVCGIWRRPSHTRTTRTIRLRAAYQYRVPLTSMRILSPLYLFSTSPFPCGSLSTSPPACLPCLYTIHAHAYHCCTLLIYSQSAAFLTALRLLAPPAPSPPAVPAMFLWHGVAFRLYHLLPFPYTWFAYHHHLPCPYRQPLPCCTHTPSLLMSSYPKQDDRTSGGRKHLPGRKEGRKTGEEEQAGICLHGSGFLNLFPIFCQA